MTLNESIKNYKFVFDVCTSERVYHLAADTEEERLDWVSTLRELLFSPQQAVSLASKFSANEAPASLNQLHLDKLHHSPE